MPSPGSSPQRARLATGVVLATVLLLGVVAPLLNAYVTPRPDHSTLSGAWVFTPDPSSARGSSGRQAGVSFLPAAGWWLGDTSRSPDAVTLGSEAASVTIALVDKPSQSCEGAFASAAKSIGRHSDLVAVDSPVPVTTTAGDPGLMSPVGSVLERGIVVMVCSDDRAVVARAVRPAGAPSDAMDDVVAMVRSVRFP